MADLVKCHPANHRLKFDLRAIIFPQSIWRIERADVEQYLRRGVGLDLHLFQR